MDVLVPYDARDPKTRLAPRLSPRQRADLASCMLRDVLAALAAIDAGPTVLATADVDCDAPVTVDERALTPAINDRLADADGRVAVVMADLALATPAALRRLFAAEGDVVIAPGLGGGTNALAIDHPDFRVDFHGTSYLDHLAVADRCGARATTLDSFRLAVDVDEPADLVEVLVHGRGETADYLRSIGVDLAVDGGRVGTTPPDESGGTDGSGDDSAGDGESGADAT